MVMAGVVGASAEPDHRLAGEVPILGVGHHGAADDLVDMGAMQREAVDQPAKRRRQHVEIGELGIGRDDRQNGILTPPSTAMRRIPCSVVIG